MDSVLHPPRLSPQHLSQDEVLECLFQLSRLALDKAQGSVLDSHPGLRDSDPEVALIGLSLCLYESAFESDAVSMRITLSGTPVRQLEFSTCPPAFAYWFRRWTELVGPIGRLSAQEQDQLRHQLLNLPRSNPNQHPSGIEYIAHSIRAIAQDILVHGDYYQHYIPPPPTTQNDFAWGISIPGHRSESRYLKTPYATPSSPPIFSISSTGSNTTYYTANSSLSWYSSSEDTRRNKSVRVSHPPPAPTGKSPLSFLERSRVHNQGLTDLTECLGEVSYFTGRIYRGTLRGGEEVALKMLSVDMYQDYDYLESAAEFWSWFKCDHPNVARLLGLAEYENKPAMVYPWMEYGSPREYAQKHPDVDLLQLCIQIANGLTYLHSDSVGINHGDLNGNNILVSCDGVPVLSGFSPGQILHSRRTRNQRELRSNIYLAPEVMNGDRVSQASDVYALGMVILETLTGEAPDATMVDKDTVATFVAQERTPEGPFETIPMDQRRIDMVWDCLITCWQSRPEDRPTAAEIHQSLQSIFETRNTAPSPSHLESSEEKIIVPIGRGTPASDIIDQLRSHNCQNVTSDLDLSACDPEPRFRGGFGGVYRGKLNDGRYIAIKLLTVYYDDEEPKDLKHTARELHTWSKCDHRNVAKLLGLAEFRGRIAMVSLWMENGNLRKYLEKHPGVDRLSLCIQIADGLAHLHSIGIVHGDLKADNVLISHDGTPVVIDFGCSILSGCTLEFTDTRTKCQTTARWSAPELLRDGNAGEASDVFALGMTIYEAFADAVPYLGIKNNYAVMMAIMNGKVPERPLERIPENQPRHNELWTCLVSCWQFEPTSRPTAMEVYQLLQAIHKM